MSIQKGKFHLSVFKIDRNPHEDVEHLLSAVAKNAVPPIDMEATGWASGNMLLDESITPENSRFGNCAVLHLRTNFKKMDPGLLKALIQKQEEEFKKKNNTNSIPNNFRKEFKENAVSILKPQATPAVKGIECVIDNDVLMIGSESLKECDQVVTRLTVDCGLEVSTPKHISEIGDPWSGGRRFLTWLWRVTQNDGPKIGETCVTMEGPLELIASDRETICSSANLRGSLVTTSTELRQMLEQEKKEITKAKLSLLIDEDIFRFTFNADKWSFGSLELPPECKTFQDRILAVRKLYFQLENLFRFWKTVEAAEHGIQELPGIKTEEK